MKSPEGSVYPDDDVQERRATMKTLLMDVLKLPVRLQDSDADLLYKSMRERGAGGASVTVRAITEVSHQVWFRPPALHPGAGCVSSRSEIKLDRGVLTVPCF